MIREMAVIREMTGSEPGRSSSGPHARVLGPRRIAAPIRRGGTVVAVGALLITAAITSRGGAGSIPDPVRSALPSLASLSNSPPVLQIPAGPLAAPAPTRGKRKPETHVEPSERGIPVDRLGRWSAYVAEASARYAIPADWIERVMAAESGGLTHMNGHPIRSTKGAIGLMQLMPSTWRELRSRLALGVDPDQPRDNILAGTFYLRTLYDRFGYPGLFAAYNAGPSRYERYLSGTPLPAETVAYLARTAAVHGQAGGPAAPGAHLPFASFSAFPSGALWAGNEGENRRGEGRDAQGLPSPGSSRLQSGNHLFASRAVDDRNARSRSVSASKGAEVAAAPGVKSGIEYTGVVASGAHRPGSSGEAEMSPRSAGIGPVGNDPVAGHRPGLQRDGEVVTAAQDAHPGDAGDPGECGKSGRSGRSGTGADEVAASGGGAQHGPDRSGPSDPGLFAVRRTTP